MRREVRLSCRGLDPAFLYSPRRGEFLALAEQGVHLPVTTWLSGDTLTPVSALLKLGARPPCFLLESVEKGTRLGRYSFLGLGKRLLLRREEELPAGDPLAEVRRFLAQRAFPLSLDLPPFAGGLVGYLGYELNRFWEPTLPPPRPAQGDPVASLPLLAFLQVEELVVFDHTSQTVHLIAHPVPEADPQTAYDSAVARLEELRGRLTSPLPPGERRFRPPGGGASALKPEADWDRRGFCRAVRQALEYIRAGEIFQVVLSRRFHLPAPADALTIYRTLRALNPSPYLFYLDFGPFQLVGSSPEMLTRLEGRKAEVRPIAGTKPRGSTAEADAALARELLADEKERAEHVMLVDLGRNDLGRVCRYGSVEVPEFMVVERYSHVMHLVSGVQGELDPRYGAVDLVGATFPAGTVTGAPKVRAMEIIRELEPVRRGPYAGAVGYFDLSGNMDLCLAIRTLLVQGGRVYIQAGAGIVADSDPEREFMETAYKAQALVEAVRLAGGMRFAGGRAG